LQLIVKRRYNKSMDRQGWLTENNTAILERLEWLCYEADGMLFTKQSGVDVVMVDKVASNLRLRFFNPGANLIQSRLDLNDPLYLVSPYSQAALLGLAWNGEPQRLYLVGFGGGRLPLVLHHYLPGAIIEAAEIDPVVIEAAIKYFGVQPDQRLRVANQDGRQYLAERPPGIKYDLIINDAFSSSSGPFHLATRGFYKLCQSRLAQGGVVLTNLLRNDPLFLDKVKTIQSVFKQLYFWPFGWGNALVIGSDGPSLERADLIKRTRRLQEYHRFSFSLVNRACEVKVGLALDAALPNLDQATILADGPEGIPEK